MVNIEEILNVLPLSIKNIIKSYNLLDRLEEIRIKINKPLIFEACGKENVTDYIIRKEELKSIIQRISNYSIYAFEEEVKQGYITVNGGHRIGICGKCVIEGNCIKTIESVSSINIRISREVTGCSQKVLQYIINGDRINNTIIISPPKCGKTTLIRDISRNISNGIKDRGFNGKKVCIVDERSEIGASSMGIPQMDVGIRTDVLDNCPKSFGIMMAIRSMSPDIIVCDEIGTYDDVKSILMALNCGINIISTIHGENIKDLYQRAVFSDLIENEVFKRAIVLSAVNGPGSISSIYDLVQQKELWGYKYDN